MTSKIISKMQILLAVSVLVVGVSGTANAQSIDLSTGTAVLANGLDSKGNEVKMFVGNKNVHWVDNTPAGEKPGNHINDVINNGYADMHRTTRNTEEADAHYVQPDYLGGRYMGVIDFGVTRDANWTTIYTVADVATSGGGTAPGYYSVGGGKYWASEARQASVANALKVYSSPGNDGYIDNYATFRGISGVYASTAELYGNAEMNAKGGVFDQTKTRGYDAGTNYREGGLQHMDRGGGVIGQSGGYYFDEAGQYTMDARGNITFNGDGYFYGNKEGWTPSKNPAGVYDDWNQHGLVTTGADLIAYTTSFDAALSLEAVISGSFNVLGEFLDVYINGNKIEREFLGLTENLYGTGEGTLYGKGIVGEYTMNLDLSLIDPRFWDNNGVNDISFMVGTVTPYQLGLLGNAVGVYNQEAGFNYFSANITYGYRELTEVPEPATLAILGLGLAGLGLARGRMRSRFHVLPM